MFAVSQVERSPSMETNIDSESSVNASDKVLAKEIDNVVTAEPSVAKPRRLSNLFTSHGRLIVSALHDIQEEQQRLSSAITSLRVHTFLHFITHKLLFHFILLDISMLFISLCCLLPELTGYYYVKANHSVTSKAMQYWQDVQSNAFLLKTLQFFLCQILTLLVQGIFTIAPKTVKIWYFANKLLLRGVYLGSVYRFL